MYWVKHHVLVCTAVHCQQKGASDVAGRLRLDIIRKGLDTEVLVNNCGTIDLCDIGPNVVVYSDSGDAVIYRGVTVKDIPEIVEHLRGGPVVDRLVVSRTSPEEEARRNFYRAAVAPHDALPSESFGALATDHGFDAAWIAEQLRRGFIARKPATDEHPETIAVTKKARARYGV